MTRTLTIPMLLAATAWPALAQDETRGLGAHEHGVGAFNLAIEGERVAMELEAPGADIVGFEHAAESEEDRAAIEAARGRLGEPLALFVLPAEAGCEVASSEVELIAEGGGHEEAHGEEHGDGHEDEHAEEDHADEHGAGHDEAHAGESRHTEFHAAYELTCADPSRLDRIEFAYFEAFPNAEELEVQMIGAEGSTGLEVTRESPTVEIPGNI
ncbi:MAG: DUF2796 domain-containing protein [Paracoccaceae bacterium]